MRRRADLVAVLGDGLVADALHVRELVDRLEAAVFAAIGDDGLGLGGADAVQRFQFRGAGGIEVDLRGEGGERGQRQRQAEDKGLDQVHGVDSF